MTLYQMRVVRTASGAEALATARGLCLWPGCAHGLGEPRELNVTRLGEDGTVESYRLTTGNGAKLYAYRVPEFDDEETGGIAWTVVCRTHYDQLRRDDRKAAAARAAELAADTQDSLF